MANHLTPDELAKEFGLDRTAVIKLCIVEHIPIYHGKVDKFLFAAARDEHLKDLVATG
jgi:hypothetical protein